MTVTYKGKAYDVYLRQLGKTGVTGTWLITAIEPHGVKPPRTPAAGPVTPTPPNSLHLGLAPHSQAQIATIQARAAAGDKNYVYYLNPIAVVERNLVTYGFAVPVPLVEPLKVTVSYRSVKYDISMIQPVKQGAQGVWVTSRIQRHAA